uniref:Decaprenyl-diphosphate synthase subunit 1 n=1 Tax=Anopheles culicifacies TaxID=139723 RepID=A0A182MHJ0_9DIPT
MLWGGHFLSIRPKNILYCTVWGLATSLAHPWCVWSVEVAGSFWVASGYRVICYRTEAAIGGGVVWSSYLTPCLHVEVAHGYSIRFPINELQLTDIFNCGSYLTEAACLGVPVSEGSSPARTCPKMVLTVMLCLEANELLTPHTGTTKCSSTANLHPCMRGYSSVHTQQPAGPIREYNIDPYILLEDELKYIFEDIRQEISRATNHQELNKIAVYYFDGQGKAFRPMVAILMAKALNYHMHNENSNIMNAQRQIAMISEMIHTASLVHDDVIDQSFARRGKPSVNVLWNHKKVTQAGDYILAVASMLLARLKQDEVTHILSQVSGTIFNLNLVRTYAQQLE